MLTTILLGIGLSMDAVAVLLSLHTIDHRKKSLIHYVLPAMFGIAHTVMPMAGWILGNGLKGIISNYDHWIAFILLFTLGAKMVYSALTDSGSDVKIEEVVNFKSLTMLTFATSIDAVIVGMTFSFLDQPVIANSLIIGATALTLSLAADLIGDRIGHLFKNSKQGVLGGLVLIGIGLKILIEHLLP